MSYLQAREHSTNNSNHIGVNIREKTFSLTQREIRHQFGISKTGLQRHIKSLLELEYLAIVSGTMNKGYRYALQYIDNTKELKDELMKGLARAYCDPTRPKGLGH